jgi:diguanylate cyclase (GGDEF)-like protein/PAS domain S-box-containing protein
LSNQVRILIVEDLAHDAELMLKELRRAGISCDAHRVETGVEYRRELEEFQPDVILSDFTMPGFDGMKALSIASQSYSHIPFIFVSGTLGEEYAVRALKNGATDYIMKSNLLRLPATVERAIKEAEERRARHALEQDLRQGEKRYRGLFQSNPHPMWVYDIETLRFLAVNDTAIARYGFSQEEFLVMTIKDLHPEKEVPRIIEHRATPLSAVNKPEIWQHRTKDGKLIEVEISSHELIFDEIPARMVVAYDVTERKRAEEALRNSEERFRLLVEQAPEAILLYDTRTNHLIDVNRNAERLFGCSREQLLNVGPQAFYAAKQPDDSAVTKTFEEHNKQALAGEEVVFERAIQNARGEDLICEVRLVSLPSNQGRLIRASFIDITERKRSEERLRESETKYRQLIEEASDGIFLGDAEDQFVLANSKGCELLGYAEGELIGKRGEITYVDEELAIRAERLAQIRAGRTLHFERMVKRKDGSVFPAEISLKMLDTGLTQAIFHDITTRRSQEQKMARLSRVQAVLSGINSAIVRTHDRQALFEEACRIAVEHGGLRMAWIGLVDNAAKRIEPKAVAGNEDGFLRIAVRLSLDDTSFEGQGRAALAVRTKLPIVSNDFASDPQIVFKKETLERGYRAGAVLPLLVGGEAIGIFSLYSSETEFFDDQEMKLLNELAGDISFGLAFIAKEEKVDYLAYYDALTGLPNRTLFSERVGQQLQTRTDSPELVAVVLLDVEHFRMVNDTLGRQTGDEVLRLIARRLESNATMTRWSSPARVVGDSFGVIIRGARDPSELAHLIEEGMKACFGESFVIDGKEVRLVARAGVSAYPADGSSAESLLHNAEAALRQAKQAKERFVFYAPEMNARVAETLALETKLRKAIELEQFVLHYQPKFNVATGNTTGVEALIRWNDPETGMVPPLQFIHILEETGMIFEVGRWALRQALADQQRWRGKGLPVPRVAVNVSAQQLRDPHFVQDVQLALGSQEGLKPALELEITESLLMEDIERNIERLKTLRDLGVTIAIDDFGTGYSSLNYLARLPMDTLKIDRSFVVGMTQSPESRTIVSTIISLAHSLGLKVVAEGVETEEQLNLLRLLKCDEMQGFLLSRPVASDDIASFLSR